MINNIAKLVVNFFSCLQVIKYKGHAAQVKGMTI